MRRQGEGRHGGTGVVIQAQRVHVQGGDGEDVAVVAVARRRVGTEPGVVAGVPGQVEGGAVELKVAGPRTPLQ